MSFRHTLIHWLAQGDFIILNGEKRETGFWVPKELGGIAIINCTFEIGDHYCALDIQPSADRKGLGAFSVRWPFGMPSLFKNLFFRGTAVSS